MLEETTRDRLAKLEVVVGNLPPNSDNLAITMEVASVELANLRLAYDGLTKDVAKKIGLVFDDVASLARELRVSIGALENYVGLLKRAVGNTSLQSKAGPAKINVPEQKPFGGTRYAKVLENIPWDVGQYFKAARVPEKEQASIASMYLVRDAKLWWQSRLKEDVEAQRQPIKSRESLKGQLKGQFLLGNARWIAWESLKKLELTGSV